MKRNDTGIVTAAVAVAMLLFVLPAMGQDAGGLGPSFAPVDQAFGDLDPLMTSLRQVEIGLSANGEQTSLFLLDPYVVPGERFEQPVYYRLGPGFRARVHRLDYLVIANPFPIPKVRKSDLGVNVAGIDGLFFEAPTAGAMYDLRPIHLRGPDGQLDLSILSPEGDPLPQPDNRINRRVDRRVDTRIDRSPVATPDAHAAGFPEALRNPYYRLQQVWPSDVRRQVRPLPAEGEKVKAQAEVDVKKGSESAGEDDADAKTQAE